MLKLTLSLLFLSVASSYRGDRILLSDVDSLSFHAGKYTTGFRGPSIPQLKCESGYCSKGPNNVLCKNQGFGDKGIVWKCEGFGMTPGYKLRYSDVSCEGYESKNDPFVLAGSCAVLYAVDQDYSYTKPITTTTTTTATTATVFNDRFSTYYTGYGYSNDIETFWYIILVFVLFSFPTYYCFSECYRPSPCNLGRSFMWYYPWTWSYPRYHYTYPQPTTYHTTTTRTTYESSDSSDRTTSTTSGNTRNR